jgi:hypothetical protein
VALARNKIDTMEPGYYWAVLYGEEMIVRVVINEIGTEIVDTFEYGWQDPRDIHFLSEKPLLYGN